MPYKKQSNIPAIKNENDLGILRLTIYQQKQFWIKNGLLILFAWILAQNYKTL